MKSNEVQPPATEAPANARTIITEARFICSVPLFAEGQARAT
ncbi:MAG: hypothetical protein SRB2_01917 [Desulfobacteraceae bacterium Eth-SRB2]|nr:MAG: hypothetical protein SRB2_01917 [Desulfobacteraceae bacterium Eth-SRB2]